MKTRLLTIILALGVNIPIFSTNTNFIFLSNVGEFLSGIQDILVGDTSDIIYRIESDTLACDSLPHWIAKAPVQIQRFHANLVLWKKAPVVLPITEQSTFDFVTLDFSDSNTETELLAIYVLLEETYGPAQKADIPGKLCYIWQLERATLSLTWTARTSAYLFIIPKGIITS